MKIMKGCILLAMILCFFGCSKDDPKPAITDDSPVHLAGVIEASAGNWVASYWKDGVYSDLTNDSVNSGVSSLYVDGSSVLIGGWIWDWSNHFYYSQKGVTWQNGKQTIIKDSYGSTTLVASPNNNFVGVWKDDSLGWVFNKNGISQPILDTASFFPTAIAASDDDLFIAGNAKGYVGNSFDWANMYAQYWKNGQLIFRESLPSYVSSIFIHGNDVYMAGYLSASYPGATIACYWKNGQRVNLTDTNNASIATSIFATDTNVYVSGEVPAQTVYWKDGVATTVWYYVAKANAIFVKGTDVYVAGSDSTDGGEEHPAYWKNGIKQKISNEDKKGRINFIVVGSN